jgi:hypothetical protein
LTRTQDSLLLDTGALRLTIRTEEGDFLAACSVKSGDGWRDVFREVRVLICPVGADGTVYDSHSNALRRP